MKSRQPPEQQSAPCDHAERETDSVWSHRAYNTASRTPSLLLYWRLILKGVDFYISETTGFCCKMKCTMTQICPLVTGHLWCLNPKLMHFSLRLLCREKALLLLLCGCCFSVADFKLLLSHIKNIFTAFRILFCKAVICRMFLYFYFSSVNHRPLLMFLPDPGVR